MTKCFEKCGVVKVDVEDDGPADAEFYGLVKELSDQITSEELGWFDIDIDTYEPVFDTNAENAREVLQSECIDRVVNEEIGAENDDGIEDVTEEVISFLENKFWSGQ